MPITGRKALNRAGMRYTGQRALIMEIIRRGRGHLDADEIYHQAREKEPRLSLSTVYRTLQMLKKLNVVDELHFDENHHHYEVKPSTEHYHLKCLGCGKVVEFSYPLSGYLKENVPAARDFDITDTEVSISGYCNRCRRGRK